MVHTTKEGLADYFGKFGNILNIEICGSPNGRSKLFGYITFQKESSIDLVLQEDSHVFEEKPIRVARAMDEETRRKYQEALVNNRIFLTSIPEDATPYEIADFVSKFGSIKYITKMRKNNKNRMFCCVTLETIGQAELLLRHKTLPFRKEYIKVKKFTTKNNRKTASSDSAVLSDTSSVYGEDEVGDELFVHHRECEDEFQNYAAGFCGPLYLSKKQKRRLRLKKTKEIEAFIQEQNYMNRISQYPFYDPSVDTYYHSEPGRHCYEGASSPQSNLYVRETDMQLSKHPKSSSKQKVKACLPAIPEHPSKQVKDAQNYPYIKYSQMRILLQGAPLQRNQPLRWDLVDITHMQSKELASLVSTGCSPSTFGDSMNLKFNLRLD